MFILLSSEKNEPRSAAAVIGLCRSAAGTALGGCGTRCAQTLFALILGWLASSRPDKGGGTLYASFWSFRATTRYPEISGLAFYPVSFSAYTFYRAAGPRIGVRGDGLCHTVLRRGGSVIPRNDAESREHPGVMPGDVHSSQQREERTKKRRRGYRALSLGGWHRPRGLRNSLRSDTPRPYPRLAGLLPAR